ncbi:cytochrome P450 2C15-like [Paramacrobiotus metropolitanus]|uniref:cytochrome P450 2C15-like n=1 Tax=Paramacrobiotus metropolitanus TaxID=2943436 RepID=UPI0024462A9E|nr:cytochrome P450 2C15-like [Paramacrobiotus metropolitanus]
MADASEGCSCSVGVILASVAALLITLWIFIRPKRSKTLPPGPPTKPLIGNMDIFLKGDGFQRLESIKKVTEEYGKDGMCTLYVGHRPNVMVSDYELIKKLTNDEKFTGRPRGMQDIHFRRKGLLFTEGELWKEQRRFALTTLRDFGMGKTWLQDLIIEEAQELINDLEAVRERPVNPNNYLTPSVANVICAISYGERFSHKDENFRRLTTLIGQNVTLAAKMQAMQVYPWLRWIPFTRLRQNYLALQKNLKDVGVFLRRLITEHKNNLEGEPRDYIHAFLLEADRQKTKPTTTFTDEQLEKAVFNLFGAGTETTSTTLTWAIIFLLENPEVYKKVQAEVDKVVPDGGFPNLEEKESMPYLQAVIQEVQRLANLVPFPIRTTTEEAQLGNYHLPAGTMVSPNLYAVHKDPKYFPNPEKFDPQRFLDEKGQIKKVDGFFPFSIGKRFCLGESLAKMELYIFFASLLKHFNFELAPGETISSRKSIFGIVNAPVPYKIIFKRRNN